MSTDDSHGPDGRAGSRPPRVANTTKVNVAFPFAQVKIQEPSEALVALTTLVEELADLVAAAAPGQQAEALRRRAHQLVSQVR